MFPEDQYVILTEPPLNPPESRELTAEIFFETFDVPVCVWGCGVWVGRGGGMWGAGLKVLNWLEPPEGAQLAAACPPQQAACPHCSAVQGLHIGVQAVLALYAGFAAAERQSKVRQANEVSAPDGCWQ